MIEKEFQNIREIINNTVEKYGDNNAFIIKNKDMTTYTYITYKRMQEDINKLNERYLRLKEKKHLQQYPKTLI